MKKVILIAFIGMLAVMIAACTSTIVDERQRIEVQTRMEDEDQRIEVRKRMEDGPKYENYKEITSAEQVKTVKALLDEIEWEQAKVDMIRPADYRFTFQSLNSKHEAIAVLYELWISPNKDMVELVVHAGSKYYKLDKDKSKVLLEILIDEK